MAVCSTRLLNLLWLFVLLCVAGRTRAGDLPKVVAAPHADKSLQFVENKNQWPASVRFAAKVPGGSMFLKPQGFVFALHDTRALALRHHQQAGPLEDAIRQHAYSVTFLGAAASPTMKGDRPKAERRNYFHGNDPANWASDVKSFQEVTYQELYPGTELQLFEQAQHLKYQFVLQPGADPKAIRMQYEGMDQLRLSDGRLHITTSVGSVTEQRPVAYQVRNGNRTEVPCRFELKKGVVSFAFPQGYNPQETLVIDPILVFSTYSGSAADNWGYTAAFDSTGNIYSGGIVFDPGFPTTVGAYQSSFSGSIDIGILKYNPNSPTGSNALIYATYMGGLEPEMPHSLVVNSQNELVILASTGSADFPMAGGGFDNTFNGGPALQYFGGFITYSDGSDIAVSKLSPNGNALIASTFIGGTGNDGTLTETALITKNYGDEFRGDIIVDASDNVYLTSSTASLDFPVVGGFQGSYRGGPSDGVVCKLSPSLASMTWSAYLGGAAEDGGFGIQLDPQNRVYVCGATTSANFPTTPGTLHPAFQGVMDGYVVQISASGNSILAGSFIGTPGEDEVYLLQLDAGGNVYVCGQTTSASYPVTPGVYSNPNSRQFIHKLNPTLSATVFSTVFGSGDGQLNISPTAFLVDECEKLTVAGWGGNVNTSHAGGTTNGMPVTPNAFQSTTDGSDFYIIQLTANAAALEYATFFGENGGVGDHVDGGTSRFDKRGIIYQAVCASCGAFSSGFPTTPNAWSATNQSQNCNNACFKFDIPTLQSGFFSALTTTGPPTNQRCNPGPFVFKRTSTGGVQFLWNFGDNTTSVLPGPVTHNYTAPGTYVVSFTVIDSSTCQISATTIDTVRVLVAQGTAGPDRQRCGQPGVQLAASGGSTYVWSPATGLSSSTIANPVATPAVTTTYTATITDLNGCISTDHAVVQVVPPLVSSPPATICTGSSATLSTTPGLQSYIWSPATGLNTTSGAAVVASPTATTTYSVTATQNGCTLSDTVVVTVGPAADILAASGPAVCSGQSTVLSASGGNTYTWSPATGLSSTNGASVTASPSVTTTYTVTGHNGQCTGQDTVVVQIVPLPQINVAVATPSLCPGQSTTLSATGGTTFTWTPATGLSGTTGTTVTASPSSTTTYTVTGTSNGCSSEATALVTVAPLPSVGITAAAPGVCPGSSTTLTATGAGTYSWTPVPGLSTTTGQMVTVTPAASSTYTVTGTSAAGCAASATVTVSVSAAPQLVLNPPAPICPGETTTLSASGADSYSWMPGNLSGSAVSVSPAATTQYTVTGTTLGCSSTSLVTLPVKPLPLPVSAGPDTIICPGTTLRLRAQLYPDYVYSWKASQELSSVTVPDPVAAPAANTVYYLTVSLDGCSIHDSVQVRVYDPVIPSAVAAPSFGPAPHAVQFSASLLLSGSYGWEFGDGETGTGTNPVHTYQEPGVYYALLTVIYGNGCIATAQAGPVEVVPATLPNIITPDNDGHNDYFVTNRFTLQPTGVKIFNRWGVRVFEEKNYRQQWQGSGLPDGVYFYEVSTADGQVWKGWLQIVR